MEIAHVEIPTSNSPTLDEREELVCPFESMEEKAAYIHGGQGLLGRDAS